MDILKPYYDGDALLKAGPADRFDNSSSFADSDTFCPLVCISTSIFNSKYQLVNE